jgi:hypothetical protein
MAVASSDDVYGENEMSELIDIGLIVDSVLAYLL